MLDLKGWVFDIHRGSLHDGPGIRTTVFLQGCSLRCIWCHNPESQARPWERGDEHRKHRAKEMGVGEVMEVVNRDRAFYEATGGGVTISGGEPTAQLHYCLDLLTRAKAEGLHTCLDTCGQISPIQVDRFLPYVDLFLFDWKASGAGSHLKLTGASQAPIRRCLEEILDKGGKVMLRCPLVPGINDDGDHLKDIAELSLRVEGVQIMPFHNTGEHKYAELGMPYRLKGKADATEDDIRTWVSRLEGHLARNVTVG